MSAQRASQLVEAGLWLRLSGDNEGAKRLFEQALKLDPQNARARQLLDSPPAQPSTSSTGQASKTTMELDWGLATGHTPTPPPVARAEPPPAKEPPVPAVPPVKHTVRLGDDPVPDLPEAPTFEAPHDEIAITDGDDEPLVGSSQTSVFGMSGIPVPPQPQGPVPTSSTMVFAGSKGVVPGVAPLTGTGGFSVPSGGTLVFNGMNGPETPDEAVPSSSTMMFSGSLASAGSHHDPPPSSTMVFSGGRVAAAPPPEVPASNTMMFSGGRGAAAPPPEVPTSNTMMFSGGPKSGEAPPSIAPVNNTMMFSTPRTDPGPADTSRSALTTDPGLPEFDEGPAIDIEAPGASSGAALEFNFDDMVAGPPPAPPIPSPTLPWDGGLENGPQTAWDRSNPRIDISQVTGPGDGGGFDLISAAPPAPPKPRSPSQLKQEVTTLLAGAKDLLDLDDHSGAMELINKALELDPTDAGAIKLKDRSERTLQTMYESKLGDLNTTPRVKLKDDEIIWLNLDHRAGFVLAQIDGSVTFEDVFAVSGMSRLDTARILAQLVEEGVINKG